MQEKLHKSQKELEAKELLIQRIEMDKREALRNFEQIEMQNFELQEKLTIAQVDAEQFQKENENLS
jgi:hypothetical protein